jgi:hypothetical protein
MPVVALFEISHNFILPKMDGLMETDICYEEEPAFFIFISGKCMRMFP